MKNLFFLSIICIAMISWAVNSTGEKANAKPDNNKEMSGTCNTDNYSIAGMHDNKQCAEPAADKVSQNDKKPCSRVTENKGSGSCSTVSASAGNYEFLSSEPRCSKKEDNKQCGTSKLIVNASASL